MYAILKGKEVVPVDNVEEWAKAFAGRVGDRILNHTTLEQDGKEILISTVFLGLNHGWGPGVNLWFETMIFGGEHDQYQDRYETYDEAIEGHKKAVELARGPDDRISG